MGALADIMVALADQIRTELEDEFDAVQVEPRLVVSPTPPCIDIYPADPFQTQIGFGGGNNEIDLLVRARVNTPDDDAAQDLLLALMDPFATTSMTQAILTDRTLGGVAENVWVIEGPSNYGVFQDAGGQGAFLGCTWTTRVMPLTATVAPVGYGAANYGEDSYGD